MIEGGYHGHDKNVELHYRAVDAVNRRDLDSLLALGMRVWWKTLLEAFPDFTIEVSAVRDHGDVTVAALHNRGHGADSDAPFEQMTWQAVRWRRGMCIWWCTVQSQAEALEAVGLSE